jgi:sulfite exporter TauE/SafE
LLTALLIFAVGLRFLFEWRGIAFIERGGAVLWKNVLPWAVRASNRHDWVGRLFLGLCWGFLPCGLVYTILLTAASTGRPLTGAVTMLSFGAGTLPAMLGLTLAAPALASVLQDKTVRRIIGFALIVLATWTLLMFWNATHSGVQQMHH